jgi:ribosomal protein S18 acetylase RimI-like enzyme
VEIIALGPGDTEGVMAAGPLFDHEPKPDAVERFLSDPNHHILLAYEGEVPAGFVTGMEMTHPDKGTEMFLYELGVAEEYRRLGIGQSLVKRLAEIARSRGCYGMWVLTSESNEAAIGTFQKAGASGREESVLFSWRFRDERQPPGGRRAATRTSLRGRRRPELEEPV